MKIAELFKKKMLYSFEVFPPKETSSIDTIYAALDRFAALKPDFISVTFGAGGSGNRNLTCEIAGKIKKDYKIESVAHLPCVNYTKADIDLLLDSFQENGIENILALRGDISPDIPRKYDFMYASDLVSYISRKGDFDIAGACYPEGHVETDNLIRDILNLKNKVDAGVSHLISQLFFDNSYYYDFLDKARLAGINVPIEAGIMPVTSKKQVERMVTKCGASLPKKFTRIIQKYEYRPEALRDAGIAYAIDQIVDLISNGVDGIHLYTMNNPYIAEKITDAVFSMLDVSK